MRSAWGRASGFRRPMRPQPASSARWRGFEQSSHLREALLEVADEILGILESDRQPHHLGTGTRLHLLRVGELAVGGRGRMNDERAGVANIGEMRKQPDARHELD